MLIKVTGKHMDVGDALTAHVEEKIQAGVSKYSEHPIDALVTFSRDRHEFKCDCSAHLSTGLTAQASAKAGDVYAAADMAVERLEKQLRRYKRRLKDHHKQRAEPFERMDVADFVIASHADDAEEPEGLQPLIVAEGRARVPALTVGEAVMQMEMADQPVLMFRNEAHGGLNVVYRRADGNIGWIDPSDTASRA